ncbi:MAG: hypothetical protein ABI551_06135 [Polyangiaceae bacterium]
MIRGLVVSAVALALLRGPGCGEVESADSSENAPCTRDKDCGTELVCRGGVCVSSIPLPKPDASFVDAPDDGDVADAISDAAADAD